MLSIPSIKYRAMASTMELERRRHRRSLTRAQVWLSGCVRYATRTPIEPTQPVRKPQLLRTGFYEIADGLPAASPLPRASPLRPPANIACGVKCAIDRGVVRFETVTA